MLLTGTYIETILALYKYIQLYAEEMERSRKERFYRVPCRVGDACSNPKSYPGLQVHSL